MFDFGKFDKVTSKVTQSSVYKDKTSELTRPKDYVCSNINHLRG